MPLRIKFFLVIILLSLATLGQLYHAFELKTSINNLNGLWQANYRQAANKSEALHKIIEHFGYGGFIHHFKNLIIREQSEYIPKAQASLQQTHLAINTFQSLELSSEERQAIEQFSLVVTLYTNSLAKAVKEVNNNQLSIDQLDQTVKVDDKPAIDALNILKRSLHHTASQVKKASAVRLGTVQQQVEQELWFLFPFYFIVAIATVSLLLAITRSYNQIKAFMNASSEAILLSDRRGKIIQSNTYAHNLLGYSEQELSELTIEDLIPDTHRNKHQKFRRQFEAKPQSRHMNRRNVEIVAQTKSGKQIPVKVSIATFSTGLSKLSASTIRDISLQKNLEHQSTTDHLTQVANRQKLEQELAREMIRSQRYQSDLSIVFTDIDHFKKINDSFGHIEGDNALKQFVHYLNDRKRESDIIGRWGGEEFMIICPNTTVEGATVFAQSLCDGLSSFTKKLPFNFTASFGVTALAAEDKKLTLIERVDTALYRAKRSGRNRVEII
jgi:diguanylate cyclase (GGDEF)-like protein/PAS domain S-box-containing protein